MNLHALGGCRCVLGLSATYANAPLLDVAAGRPPSLRTLRRRKPTLSRKLESAKASPMLPGGYHTGCVGAVYLYCSVLLVLPCVRRTQILRSLPPSNALSTQTKPRHTYTNNTPQDRKRRKLDTRILAILKKDVHASSVFRFRLP